MIPLVYQNCVAFIFCLSGLRLVERKKVTEAIVSFRFFGIMKVSSIHFSSQACQEAAKKSRSYVCELASVIS